VVGVTHKAGEGSVTGCTAEDADICYRCQQHCGLEMTTTPNKMTWSP
jgi:hypothetical protein